MSERINQKSASIRAVAMPADTNPSGDIFGGWVLSQMDLAGGVLASQISKKRMTTVAVDKMRFHKPIMVGDLVSFYTEVSTIGKTSITIDIQTYVTRKNVLLKENQEIKVTEGKFVYVSIDNSGKPIPIVDK
tara:strand:+ start:15121 stop:15516 length:396 start_codon:yes stop_codon:yes gene_type:complete